MNVDSNIYESLLISPYKSMLSILFMKQKVKMTACSKNNTCFFNLASNCNSKNHLKCG